MKKYLKLVIVVATFAVLFVGGRLLYQNLMKDYEAEQFADIGTSERTAEEQTASERTAEEQENKGYVVQENDGSGSDEPQAESVKSSTVVDYDFTVLDSSGTERTLSSFVGKPIVVNFWASWCSVCKEEFPDFQSAYETYGTEVEFVMVNMTDGYRETQSAAQSFIDQSGYTFPVYYDVNQSAARTYGISALPTTFFVDAEGNLITYAQGMLTEESLQKGLGMILPEEDAQE